MTVRDMVRQMQVEIRDTPDLQPDRASELMNRLTALMGNVNDEIREADVLYAHVLLGHLDAGEPANRARIRAETSPAYVRKQEARHTKELTIELVRSLKYFMRAKSEELGMTR
jgi:hypothetical protein